MTVFYFTATGNSLYVAKRLGGKLLSIPQVLKTSETAYSDDVIGIVCPCYAGGIPRIVNRFLNKATLKSEYIFTIMTYGNEQTSALDQMKKYGAAQGVRFNYMNSILMVNNYLPMFNVEEEIVKIPQKNIENAINAVIKDVLSKKQYILPTSCANKFWGAVFRSGAKKMTGGNSDIRFTVNDVCTSCGICAKLCPVSNITVGNNVVYHHQCEGCLACIHHCPAGAIHIKGEKNGKRFCNGNIGLEEIIAANDLH